jgi:hypothetical protein|tara:strand:+ start:345 stop:806 length:462 start_codon:yes stop_codon:yes gene_type:complete
MYHKTKFKLTCLASCLLLLSTPGVGMATEGRVASLTEGESAPFTGVLFDETFAARLIAEEEHKQIECNLKIKFEIEKMEAKHALEMGNVQATLDTLRTQHRSITDIKDSEIKRLQELALKNPNDNANWWFGGGVAVGVLTSILIFYAAVEVQK